MKASVKIMRSYDYNHFEICLSSDEDMTLKDVDDLRKEAARLADKAVEQYKIAKRAEAVYSDLLFNFERLSDEVQWIRDEVPESELTEEHKAKIKALADHNFHAFRHYDYEDDYDFEPA